MSADPNIENVERIAYEAWRLNRRGKPDFTRAFNGDYANYREQAMWCAWFAKARAAQSDLSAARAECERLRETLAAIADAKPSKWEPEMRDQFQPWAQNIARHAINKSRNLEPK